MQIEPAQPRDYDQIAAIWDPVIRETTIIFHTVQRTPEMVGDVIVKRRQAGRDFWVARDGDVVLGFATYDRFRDGDGYDYAMEHSIILTEDARGRGVGRALMDVLEAHAAKAGVHVMIAAIDAANASGQAFHAALGYEKVGLMPQVGRKFDRWLDLVLMQKIL
ncbi:GNAT family N-acetyltransferase [Qingshengfaniella alkalisoli]|uniref:N-acetyltransferase n=1 Tax=Qingshengfaniella alkalisoli TaxID=2599296 RepID=A0A5B8IY35_9RHOB|nr:GNAT family N-acetyltransferase [Qingshengfaniella alkalisoli]QDY69568.1 N-acetyltransferase [Qingshengfaniella alkalisoli]